jgi:hypothetical protein
LAARRLDRLLAAWRLDRLLAARRLDLVRAFAWSLHLLVTRRLNRVAVRRRRIRGGCHQHGGEPECEYVCTLHRLCLLSIAFLEQRACQTSTEQNH